MATPEHREITQDELFIIVTPSCRSDEELGRVCKAFYDQRKDPIFETDGRYVTLVRLHGWYSQLTSVHEKLRKTVSDAMRVCQDFPQPLARLLPIYGYSLFEYKLGNVTNDESKVEGPKDSKEPFENYVVMAWAESISLETLLRKRITTPTEAVEFVRQLAEMLTFLYELRHEKKDEKKKTDELKYPFALNWRPLVSIENIVARCEKNGGEQDFGLALADWGFATALDNAGRTKAHEKEDAKRLAKLLISLLDGLYEIKDRKTGDGPLTFDSLTDNLATVREKYKRTPNQLALQIDSAQVQSEAQLWQILSDIQNPAEAKLSYDSPDIVACMLHTPEKIAKSLDDLLNPILHEKGRDKSTANTLGNSSDVSDTSIEGALDEALATQPPAGFFSSLAQKFLEPVKKQTETHVVEGEFDGSSTDTSSTDTVDLEIELPPPLPQKTQNGGLPGKESVDRLKIEILGKGGIEYEQMLQRLDEGAAKPHVIDDLLIIGAGVIRKDGRPINASRLPAEIEALRTRRIYIYCNQSASSDEVFYTVADLGYEVSNRKAAIDGHPLSPLFGTLLTPGSPLLIDDSYRVTLERLSSQNDSGWGAARERNAEAMVLAEKRFFPQLNDGVVQVPIRISNPTEQVDRLTLVADQMPKDWPLPQPLPIPLFDKESREVLFEIPLGRRPLTGEHTITIRAISDNVDAQIAVDSIKIRIQPHFTYSGYLYPEAIRVGDFGELRIENSGNVHQEFQVSWRDNAGELSFTPPQALIGIEPYQAGQVGYRAYARRWRLLGRAQSHNVTATINPQNGGMPQTFSGVIKSRAIIPSWAPWLLLLTFLAFFLVYSFLFAPGFSQTAISAQEQPRSQLLADTPEQALEWSSFNSCFYSFYQNNQAVEWYRRLNHADSADDSALGTTFRQQIAHAADGDTFEIKLHGCTLVRSHSWAVTAVPAPTLPPPTPMHPQNANFNTTIENVESAGFGTGGSLFDETDLATKPLLLGQTGEFCIEWDVTNEYDTDVYHLVVDVMPELDALSGLRSITEPQGIFCKPIAQTFNSPEVYTISFGYIDTRDGTEIPLYEQAISAKRPSCTVNTGAPLWIREGPGRNFQPRGQLQPGDAVFPLSRPFLSSEDINPEPWVQVNLLADPRPVWIAYNYLYCPINIDPLPAVGDVPLPPTATPTPTAAPTATPVPVIEPEVALEPPIINLGGCAMLTWSIQNVQAVYLNNVGVVGESEQQVCPTEPGEHEFNWRIVGQDGNISEKKKLLLVNPTSPVGPPTPPTQ